MAATGHEAAAGDRADAVRPGRGHWLIGPEPVAALGGSPVRVAADRWLSAAPGLGVVTAESSRARVTLAGYALDATDAGASDLDLATRIAEAYEGPERLPLLTAAFGGRWIVVIDDGTDPYLATDAFAQRRVLHGPGGWCSGSELALLGHAGAVLDPDAQAYAGRSGSITWPGTTTSLVGFRRLMPSQVLNLRTGGVTTVPLVRGIAVPPGRDAALDLAAATLAGVTAAAARRFPLAVLLTGGADSRLMLAACRGLTDGMRFVTIDNPAVGGSREDVRIAAELARALSLDHVVVTGGEAPSPAFAAQAAAHTTTTAPLYHANSEALTSVLPAGAVGVSGHLGEVWRGSLLYREPADGIMDADWFLGARHLLDEPFAARAVREWFAAASDELPLNVRAMWDLDFSSRVAQWAELSDLLWQDVLCPYGTRLGTAAALTAPPELRDCGTALFEDLCRRLWPAVLDAAVLPKLRLRRRPLHVRMRARVRRAFAS